MNSQDNPALNIIVTVTRVGVIVFWVAFVLALASVIPLPYSQIIIWIGAFVLFGHLSEYLLIRFGFIVLETEKVSFVMTMLFGFSYFLPLMKRD